MAGRQLLLRRWAGPRSHQSNRSGTWCVSGCFKPCVFWKFHTWKVALVLVETVLDHGDPQEQRLYQHQKLRRRYCRLCPWTLAWSKLISSSWLTSHQQWQSRHISWAVETAGWWPAWVGCPRPPHRGRWYGTRCRIIQATNPWREAIPLLAGS